MSYICRWHWSGNDRYAVESPFTYVFVHIAHWQVFIPFCLFLDILMYILEMDVITTPVLGSDGIHLCFFPVDIL